MKKIITKRGQEIIVDAEDYMLLNSLAWHVNSAGYAKHGTNTLMHRLIMDAPAGYVVDHINGNPLDNRKSNLRICTQAENLRNQRKTHAQRSARYKGVSITRNGKWRARITLNQKWYSLGHYATPEEAAVAYNEAAKELHGEYACLNVLPTAVKEVA